MELRLQKFISSMGTLSDIRNLDPYNPVVTLLEHPVTAMQYVVITAIPEPSYMGIPINAIWVVQNPQSKYYRRALKLKAHSMDAYDGAAGEAITDAGLQQAWIAISTYDDIFADPQWYDNGAGGGIPGPKGDKGDKGDPGPMGPMGLQGPKGDTPTIDYDYIITEVVKRVGSTAPTYTLAITGADTVMEGATSQYQVVLNDGTTNTQIVAPITITSGGTAASINSSNLLTALNVLSDQVVTLSASYVTGGKTLTATKTVTITNAVLSSIAATGIPTTTYEGKTNNLAVTATYSNGTTASVTGQATYSISPANAGTVAANGSFTAATGLAADVPATITVTYVEGGVTKTASVAFTVKKVIATAIAITGAASVNGGATSQYSATVTKNDGSTTTAGVTWSLAPAGAGSIDTAGLLTAGNVTANTNATVTASATIGGATVTATKAVTIAYVAPIIYPFYGVAKDPGMAGKTGAWILSALTNRGPNGSRVMDPLVMDSGTTAQALYQFYAYPVSYGQATFTDKDTQMQGGWDGALGDPYDSTKMGPLTVNVTINGQSVPFYLYQTDKVGIGKMNWAVS